MITTSIGQLAVNQGLPEDMQSHSRVLDKKGLEKLLQEVAEKHPEKYRDIAQHLLRVGGHAARLTGANTFGPEHLRASPGAKAFGMKIKKEVSRINSDPSLSDDEKEKKVVDLLSEKGDEMTDIVMKESLATGNPLAQQVISGSRGNALNLRGLRGGSMLYVDHKYRPIPVPILRSFSEGLTPVEYFSSSYGARKGVVDVKKGVQNAGYAGKQLKQTTHRLVVTGLDSDEPETGAPRGLPTTVDDPDNQGALLAVTSGPYERNTVLTSKVLAHLKDLGIERLLVRSPIASSHPEAGVYGRDVGHREMGRIPENGSFVGQAASDSLSELLTQAQLGSKHSGGVSGAAKSLTGFELINELIQIPAVFKGGGAHSSVDGKVTAIQPASQGGTYYTVNGKQHYSGHGFIPKVKVGDEVEAGDMLSDGLPNPAEIVKHKGIGEGSRKFVEQFRQAYKDSGFNAHRRNIELLARGLIDHVQLDEEHGEFNPGDIVSYRRLEHAYKPRDGHELSTIKGAKDKYLEAPALHFSIGTHVKPSVQKMLNDYGIENVLVHKDPPPFKPIMVRAMETMSHDPDWMSRFLGAYVQKNFLKGVHRAHSSDENSTSYVGSLARGVDFGHASIIKNQPIHVPLPKPPTPAPSIMAQMNELSVEPKTASSRFKKPIDLSIMGLLKFKHKAGTHVVFNDEPEDEDDDSRDYPLDEITYPVDCYTLPSHKAEDGEDLDVFKGTDEKGDSGSFKILLPELYKKETKFFFNCSPFEKDQLLRAFAPLIHDMPVTYSNDEDFQSDLKKHLK